MKSKSSSEFVAKMIAFYFFIAVIALFASAFAYKPLIVFSRFFLPILLLSLYYLKSQKKDPIFYFIMILFLISNVSFLIDNSQLYIGGVFAFILYRIFAIYLIIKLKPKNNYLLISLATLPFLLIFFYLSSEIVEISNFNSTILIIQSILISILGGISLTNYIKEENRQNSWLLISTLLFIGLRFIVFVGLYFLPNDVVNVFRTIETFLTAFGFFTFYKFVIAAENNFGSDDILKNLNEDAK